MISIKNYCLQFSNFSLTIPSIDLPEKGLIFLKGNNGSGKSSLLKSIGGFISSYSGNILLNGIDISTLSQKQLIQKISVLPQSFGDLPAISGQEYIDQGLYLSGEDQSSYLIENLKVSCLLDKMCSTLSGGQRQMLTIVRNLSRKKPVILLDEPDSFLSKSNRILVADLIHELSKNHLVIISSHQENLFTFDKVLTFDEISDDTFLVL